MSKKRTQSEFCIVDNCGKPTICFSWCWMHYARAKRNKSMELKKKSIICKHCHAPRYRFNGGESNLCKNHISIYRKAWYKKHKASEPSRITALAGVTGSEGSSKTSADDSVPSQQFTELNQKQEGQNGTFKN